MELDVEREEQHEGNEQLSYDAKYEVASHRATSSRRRRRRSATTPAPAGKDHCRFPECIVAAITLQTDDDDVRYPVPLPIPSSTGHDMCMDRRIGSEMAGRPRVPYTIGRRTPIESSGSRPVRAGLHFLALGEVERTEQENRGHASPHRSFGHGDVDGVEFHKHSCHQEAVDAGENDDGKEIALHAHGEHHSRHDVSSSMLMISASMSRLPREDEVASRGQRPPWLRHGSRQGSQ